MITAAILWLVLQVPLGIVVGKCLKVGSGPLDATEPLVRAPIAAAPSTAELLSQSVYADVMP
jgi:hypothetical protein